MTRVSVQKVFSCHGTVWQGFANTL
jgi:hypothetical protein